VTGLEYSAWHYAPDAFPRLVSRPDGRFDLHLVVGTWSRVSIGETVTVRWNVRGRASVQVTVPAQDVTVLDDEFEQRLRLADAAPVTGPHPRAVAPYRLALARRSRGNRYAEAVIRGLPALSEIEYTIEVDPAVGRQRRLGPYSVLFSAPRFRGEDMIGGRSGGLVDGDPAWIGHVRRERGYTHVRIDLDDIPADGGAVLPLRLRIGGQWFEADPALVTHNVRGRLPLVDWTADTVTLTAADPERLPVVVEVGGRRVSEADAGGRGRSRLLIAHFCIQAINDLLEEPFSGPGGVYTPPRTYMQVTMSDELGVYSSRPGAERINPGGYRDGLTMHRRYGVPYLLAVNGGVLVLAQHDCPDDLARMCQDVQEGLLHPAIAGYGSHRIPYYSAEANVRDITACVDAITTYLRPADAPQVFYPDQRLYRQGPATVPALRTPPVRYVVLDSATGFADNVATIEPGANAAGRDLGSAMLWTDRRSGAHLLFIDTILKDQALGANLDPNEPAPWKPPLAVRRRFMRLALDPHLRDHNLLTYGDDFEKVCNNGWFEPVPDMREKWAALLGWVAAHRTWLQVVTPADLDPDIDSVGEIDVVTSIDATLDPGGLRSVDLEGRPFHYDTWQKRWADTPAWWIGGTLGEITGIVETALRRWPADARDQLHETAWLAFLMAQHENAWNMQALEGDDPNRKQTGDPEEFTIVEGLQVRNALVWLKASLWARWARSSRAGTAAGDDPLAAAIESLPGRVGPDLLRDALRWDADPNPTLVLYNLDALVIIDRNGGRVTHAFVMREGVPRTVSGTFKSYQYRNPAGVECDGYVVQNTVWTPNHRYIGADPDHLTQRHVDWTYTRPVRNSDPVSVTVRRVVPDNFNAYTCTADPASNTIWCVHKGGNAPDEVTEEEFITLLKADGAARRAGAEGTVWHADVEFAKTFQLKGTTLDVAYTGVASGHLVDNEFCVDLYSGVRDGHVLTRHHDEKERSMTLAMPGGGAAVRLGRGCVFTDASQAETLAEAARDGRTAEFLTLHRVLTDAIQLRATDPDFEYTIELRA
jgi:hypothetical protein